MRLLPYVTGGPGGVNGGVLELAAIGGVILGDTVKWALKCVRRRLATPGGRHRHRLSVYGDLTPSNVGIR